MYPLCCLWAQQHCHNHTLKHEAWLNQHALEKHTLMHTYQHKGQRDETGLFTDCSWMAVWKCFRYFTYPFCSGLWGSQSVMHAALFICRSLSFIHRSIFNPAVPRRMLVPSEFIAGSPRNLNSLRPFHRCGFGSLLDGNRKFSLWPD